MLAVNSYPQAYIDDCRWRVQSQIDAFKKLASTARKEGGTAMTGAMAGFAPLFFNNMVIVLDGYFMHRSRIIEGKDGNPCNEVRLLCESMMTNDNILAASKVIKYVPSRSVVKLEVGDNIALTEADFVRLQDAYFNEMTRKFSDVRKTA